MNRQMLGTMAAAALVAGGAGYWLGGRSGTAVAPMPSESQAGSEPAGDPAAHAEGEVRVSPAQIAAIGIGMTKAVAAPVGGEVLAVGLIVPKPNATGHVTARTSGVVTRLLVQIGDRIGAGAGLAVIDSRDAAEAQAALATARSRLALAEKTYAREERLFAQRVTARADFEQAQAAREAARIETVAATQGLAALGLSPGGSRLFTLRSPVAGEVAQVSVTPGEFVTPERELFQVTDRRAIWAELRVPARELTRVRAGQAIEVTVQGADHAHRGTLNFLSPAVETASGAARAIAVVRDPDGELRQGQSVTARIATPGGTIAPTVPRVAVQDLAGRPVAFVRTPQGFVARPVTLGRGTEASVPVLAGLAVGETVATTNSFALKAELGKGEAEHE